MKALFRTLSLVLVLTAGVVNQSFAGQKIIKNYNTYINTTNVNNKTEVTNVIEDDGDFDYGVELENVIYKGDGPVSEARVDASYEFDSEDTRVMAVIQVPLYKVWQK